MNIIQELKNNQKGSFLIPWVMMVLFLFTLVAFSTGVGRMQFAYTDAQGAVDSAALSVSEWLLRLKIDKIGEPGFEGNKWMEYHPTNAEISGQAKDIFLSNFNLDQENAILDETAFVVRYDDSERDLKINVCVEVQDAMFSETFFGDAGKKVCVNATAGFLLNEALTNTEVAFSLDVTGSMQSDSKMPNLHAATKSILGKYFKDMQKNNTYISVVPYSNLISLRPYHEDIVSAGTKDVDAKIDESVSLDASNFDPSHPTNGMDGEKFVKFKPYQDLLDKLEEKLIKSKGEHIGNNQFSDRYDKLVALRTTPALNIQPLSNNEDLLGDLFDSLLNLVMVDDDWETAGGTSGITGLVGAWLTLTPSYRESFRQPSMVEESTGARVTDRVDAPSDYGKRKKFIIHISDGGDNIDGVQYDNVFNLNDDDGPFRHQYEGIRKTYDEVCNAAKNNGIQIVVILYGYSGGPTSDAIERCASSPDLFFVGVEPDDVLNTLDSIFANITSLTDFTTLK